MSITVSSATISYLMEQAVLGGGEISKQDEQMLNRLAKDARREQALARMERKPSQTIGLQGALASHKLALARMERALRGCDDSNPILVRNLKAQRDGLASKVERMERKLYKPGKRNQVRR